MSNGDYITESEGVCSICPISYDPQRLIRFEDWSAFPPSMVWVCLPCLKRAVAMLETSREGIT